MSNKYKLLLNSKLECVGLGDEVGIFKKGDKNIYDNAILRIPYNSLTTIEEFSTEKEDESKILIFEPFFDAPATKSSRYYYKITSYHLNVSTHVIYRDIACLSTIVPEKISSKYYLYKNIINAPILIDGDSNTVCLIEPKLSEDLEITNPEFYYLDKKNHPNIHELEFDINDIERLHIFLKIDEEVKVYNIFYSEMKKGMPLTVYCPGDESEYLDIKTFYNRLLNHPLITDIKKETNLKEIDLKMTKQKIRKKAIDIFSNNK